MASFSGPKLSNRIADDVPDIQAVLSSLAKLTPDSGNTDYPIGTKRVAETTNGYEFQQYNGTSWVTLEKWNLDAQKVDGYSASTGTTANTIPVRNANGKLPGDILGNAATATKANALSETNPIPMGGTGATTAEQARANLGTPPKTHASTSTEYGTGTSIQYGHLKSHDAPDATKTASAGHAFSPAGAAALQETINKEIDGLAENVDGLAEKVDTVREDTLAAAQQASASGGSGETGSVTLEGVTSEVSRLGVEVARLCVEVAKKARVDASNFSVDGKSHLAELGMPGSSWFTIDDAPATGATYVAPATGWVRAAGFGKSSALTSIDLRAGSLISRVIIPTVASSVSVYLPVKRGDDINLQFTANDVKLYFIYAKGTE